MAFVAVSKVLLMDSSPRPKEYPISELSLANTLGGEPAGNEVCPKIVPKVLNWF